MHFDTRVATIELKQCWNLAATSGLRGKKRNPTQYGPHFLNLDMFVKMFEYLTCRSYEEKSCTAMNLRKTHLTQLSSKLRWALTREAVHCHCMTLAAVLARLTSTLIPLDLAVNTNKTGSTQAAEAHRTFLKNTKRELSEAMWNANVMWGWI